MEQAPIGTAVTERVPRFMPPEILWYLGAIAAAAAAESLIAGTTDAHRGIWMLLVGLAVMGVFAVLAAGLIRLGRRVPGGVLAAAVVLVAPATEVAFEHLCGVHPRLGSSASASSVTGVAGIAVPAPAPPGGGFHGALFAIALGTAALGLVVYGLVRFAFVLLPVVVWLAAAAALFMPAVVSNPGIGDYILTVLLTGVVFFVVGLLLDARLHRREAFWWYVGGLFEIAAAFVYYLARYHHHHSWIWLTLLVVAAIVLAGSAPMGRAVWAAYAVVGVYLAIAHYLIDATGSWRTTLALTLLGLLLVPAGSALAVLDGEFVRRVTRPWIPERGPQPPA
ncbi:MAG TPA: hypothetical protein VGL76_04805 [Gaiellaceae bacterium]